MNILIIEDNQDHFEHIEDCLQAITEIAFVIKHETTMALGKQALKSGAFDICLFDLQLPDSSIQQTIYWLKSVSHETPIITLTSLDSNDVAKDLLKHGIQDYLAKNEITPPLLYRTCYYAIERWKHQQARENYNQDMQAFCASLSHDFNNHINSILMFSELIQAKLKRRVDLLDDEAALFAKVHNSTRTIHSLVSDLQQYLSIGYEKREFVVVDLNTTIENVIQAFKDTTADDFTVDVVHRLPIIQGNAGLLHLLFHNLIGNSIKFNNRIPNVKITVEDNDESVNLTLQDNGIGFDQDHATQIFSPFVRLDNSTKTSGSGLGMSIVKRVVDYHGAGIEIASTIGTGSLFTLTFPK